MVHCKDDHLQFPCQFPFRIPWGFHIRQGTGAVSTAPPEASWAPVLKNKNTGNSLGFSRNIAETNETKKPFSFLGGAYKVYGRRKVELHQQKSVCFHRETNKANFFGERAMAPRWHWSSQKHCKEKLNLQRGLKETAKSAVCQNLVPLVNIKIAGIYGWSFP